MDFTDTMLDVDYKTARKKCEEHEHNWLKQWPDYCHGCFGAYFRSWTESHGETMSEPCWDLDSGICHRCKRKGLTIIDGEDGLQNDEKTPCFFCGWNYGNSENDQLPEGW